MPVRDLGLMRKGRLVVLSAYSEVVWGPEDEHSRLGGFAILMPTEEDAEQFLALYGRAVSLADTPCVVCGGVDPGDGWHGGPTADHDPYSAAHPYEAAFSGLQGPASLRPAKVKD